MDVCIDQELYDKLLDTIQEGDINKIREVMNMVEEKVWSIPEELYDIYFITDNIRYEILTAGNISVKYGRPIIKDIKILINSFESDPVWMLEKSSIINIEYENVELEDRYDPFSGKELYEVIITGRPAWVYVNKRGKNNRKEKIFVWFGEFVNLTFELK